MWKENQAARGFSSKSRQLAASKQVLASSGGTEEIAWQFFGKSSVFLVPRNPPIGTRAARAEDKACLTHGHSLRPHIAHLRKSQGTTSSCQITYLRKTLSSQPCFVSRRSCAESSHAGTEMKLRNRTSIDLSEAVCHRHVVSMSRSQIKFPPSCRHQQPITCSKCEE